MTAFALSNRALVLSKKNQVSEAVRLSRMAVEISSALYENNSFEYLQHVRILITLLIRSREFHKAEHILGEHDFSRQGKPTSIHSALLYLLTEADVCIWMV